MLFSPEHPTLPSWFPCLATPNVLIVLPDGDVDVDGDGKIYGKADSNAGEHGKHRLRWKAQIEIDNIPLSIV